MADVVHVVSEVRLAAHRGKGLIDLLSWERFFGFWDGVLGRPPCDFFLDVAIDVEVVSLGRALYLVRFLLAHVKSVGVLGNDVVGMRVKLYLAYW